MIMKNKRFIILSGILLISLIFVSSYNMGKRSETIIIPNKEESQIDDDQKSDSFQVKKIYRLPQADQLLGWSSSNSVVGFFKGNDTTEGKAQHLQNVSYPFEKPETLQSIDRNTSNLKLSPDGKSIAGLTMSSNKITLNLISLTNRNKKEVASFSSSKDAFVQDISWSNNSKYICYLVIDTTKNDQTAVNVFNIDSGTLKTYPLKNVDEKDSLTAVSISNDGRSLLLTMLQGQQYRIMTGTISGDSITIQNKRQISPYGEPVWLNNDQFVFLGIGETLYEYDLRNSELSVLLENVAVFTISNDRKKIAYSLYDKDNTYAGKLQGKNVLYAEPIYHGTSPSEIYWSPDGSNLLVYEQNRYISMENSSARFFDDRSYIISFK
ncbi:WD40 repeat domain-containing protein [Bacillus subtilis]|uniref:WD40 repeat domain-containing protein n=1 Tax=Bacillus subtilis TaxID=1423 RepID=UPI00164BD004|nr:WD40 repeat domain-containing protein [Bacillus subtilis]MED2948948.1 WD40 repeat domain-containing protein [Bacillus subtilis]QNK37339.1 WD40 repeat domain-containing protein [Bacillus subtilis subsp. subtilis]WJF87352.1 WD40 repeat domain-containing protein [Bacillus subtilis]